MTLDLELASSAKAGGRRLEKLRSSKSFTLATVCLAIFTVSPPCVADTPPRCSLLNPAYSRMLFSMEW